MADYQVIARKYRPQTFKEVIGQDAIVTTLKNAIKFKRLHHAYLFTGSRGTGKTTLARVFAKALNCEHPTSEGDPCNQCHSCKEIASGFSLDVLEIDGASHRGIEDIRQINETAIYAASGKFKIYIIDEVHMLTKEAFNALLKTLEEPPPKVKFFFATTEPHKVLPTIVSRCQRYNLQRISPSLIVQKLQMIAKDVQAEIDLEALHLIANMADGALRDAESLLDQVLSFTEGKIGTETIVSILGVMPKEIFFKLDQAASLGHVSVAFDIAHQVFTQGKDLTQFVRDLIQHYRTLSVVKVSGRQSPSLFLSPQESEKYELSSSLYTQEECLTILDFLIEKEQSMRFSPSQRIALESLLLKIIRIHQQIPIELLVQRLNDLSQKITNPPQVMPSEPSIPQVKKSQPSPPQVMPSEPSTPQVKNSQPSTPQVPPSQPISQEKKAQYDTLLQFAAVELNGRIERKST